MGLRSTLLWLRNPYQYLDGALGDKGITFRAQLPVLGSCLFTGDPELVSRIEQDKALIGGRGTTALVPVVGKDSMIVLEGAKHEKHRRIFVPPFFAGRTAVDELTTYWAARAVDTFAVGTETTAMQLVTGITLNVIVEVVFGKLAPHRHRRILELVEAWMLSFRTPLVLFVRAFHVDLGPASPWGRFRRNREAVEQFVRDELAMRRSDPGSGLLGHALARATQGEQLDDDELVSETITFLLFGHDTTAAAMAWVFYHLGLNAQTWHRIRDEWRPSKDAAPDPEKCSFTRAAIEESMRLCPVVVHLTRHAVRTTYVGEHEVREGERVLPCAYLAHHNPAVFEEPYRFKPERFTGGADFRHAYFPFGLGSRICAGMPFALRQMVIITGTIASALDYELVNAEAIRPVRKMVLMIPSGGTRLRRAR